MRFKRKMSTQRRSALPLATEGTQEGIARRPKGKSTDPVCNSVCEDREFLQRKQVEARYMAKKDDIGYVYIFTYDQRTSPGQQRFNKQYTIWKKRFYWIYSIRACRTLQGRRVSHWGVHRRQLRAKKPYNRWQC